MDSAGLTMDCKTLNLSDEDQLISPLLSIANPRPRLLQGPSLLHDLFNTSNDPKSIAIDYRKEDGTRDRFTYDEIHLSSDRLGSRIKARLVEYSVERQPTIAIFLPQSPNLVVSLLGVLKSGCCFCPLGLDSPNERLLHILHDVEAAAVITDSANAHRFDGSSVPKINIDDPSIPPADEPHNDSVPCVFEVSPENLAYIMYTSGSSGKPKGVAMSHRAVTQSLLAHDPWIPTFSKFLQFASITFDVSIFEIFFPFFRGATLAICHRPSLLRNLKGVIEAMEIDAVELTPTVVDTLLQTRGSVPSLQLLLTIGEMLTPNIIREFGHSKFRPGILWGMYGPTECAIHCTL